MCRYKSNKQPVCCVSITLPPHDIDVNLEPNKTKVLMESKVSVKTCSSYFISLLSMFPVHLINHRYIELYIYDRMDLILISLQLCPKYLYLQGVQESTDDEY